jgi:hypothetical protein
MKKVSNIWIKDGSDYILHLGTMQKAVVVSFYIGSCNPYAISPRSYFPFTDEERSQKFLLAADATEYAILILKAWFKSIITDMDGDGWKVEGSHVIKSIGEK